MNFKITLFLIFLAGTAFAQEPDTYKAYDFSNLDLEKIEPEAVRDQIDSIYRTSGIDSLSQLLSLAHSVTYTEKYVSFIIGYQSSSASLSSLNSGLAALGLDKLSENVGGVPWGFDVRGRRLLFTYWFAPGIKNRVSNDDYSIEVEGMSFQLGIGYDILNLKRLQLYPQLAFGHQSFDIEVHRKNAVNDVVTVNDLILDPAGTSMTKSSFDMTYGLELDYHLLYSKANGGIILGLRYGRVVTLAEGPFKINKSKTKFESSDSISESFVSIVAKFYRKRQRV
jgi:hypothetical protein